MTYWFNLYGLGYMRLHEYPITASIRWSFAQTSWKLRSLELVSSLRTAQINLEPGMDPANLLRGFQAL